MVSIVNTVFKFTLNITGTTLAYCKCDLHCQTWFRCNFICRLSFVRSAPWQSTPLADVDNAFFLLLEPKVFQQNINNGKRRRGIVALPLAGRLWYTKRVPTLHGGGSFGWLTRGWAQQIPPHISGTLACLASLPRQGPTTTQDAEPLLMETLVSHTEPFHSD